MPQRILVAIENGPVAASLRRHLERAGFRLDLCTPLEAPRQLEPGAHALAIVRAGDVGDALIAPLKQADPDLPVVVVFEDEDEADGRSGATRADGLLVGPLGEAAVVSCCRAMARLGAQARRIAELEHRPEAAAAPVGPAGAADHELFKKLLLMEVKRSRRYHYPVSLALVAIDGWAQRSRELRPTQRISTLAQLLGTLSAAVRDIDLPLLFPGDRFVVLMPHTAAEGAAQVARRLCSRIRDHHGPQRMTASAGVASYHGHGTVSFGQLVKDASQALARAQDAGGDRAEHHGPPRKRDRVSIG